MRADSIISLAIALALPECPEAVQTDVLNLICRQAELLEENQDLHRRVTELLLRGLPGAGVDEPAKLRLT